MIEVSERAFERLVFELQTHQIELEMQNEELLRIQNNLSDALFNYIDLYENSATGYMTLSTAGIIEELNIKSAQLLKMNKGDLFKRKFLSIVAPDSADDAYLFFRDIAKSGKRSLIELALQQSDGEKIFVLLECKLFIQSHQEPKLRLSFTDLSDTLYVRELEAQKQELQISAIAFETQEAIVITDSERNIIRVNQAFCKITGYSEEDVINFTPHFLHSCLHDIDFDTAMWQPCNCLGAWTGDVLNKHQNGDVYPEHLTINTVRDKNNNITNYVITFIDISMSRDIAQEMRQMAFYDSLTSIPNRRLLQDRLHVALITSHRTHKKGAVLFIDLDKFKSLNDNYGHNVGDELLIQVATRLASCVRASDTVARFGGDEFIIMLENLDEDYAIAMQQALEVGSIVCETLAKPFELKDNLTYNCASSIGVSIFNGEDTQSCEILRQSDTAMYVAKQNGRNNCQIYNSTMKSNGSRNYDVI